MFCPAAVYAADQTVPTTISTTPAVKRIIGIKSAEAESVYFTNKLGADVKGIYIKCSDEKTGEKSRTFGSLRTWYGTGSNILQS